MGGSLTFRSREILNADTIVGNFGFNNNQTSNCAGKTSGLHASTPTPASTSRASCSAAPTRRPATCSTPRPTPRSGPSGRSTCRTTSGSPARLTLNYGLRWDVYVPWVEMDDRQSNFDESTGKFVVASDDAVINGVKVGRYLQTYSKGDLGPRFGFAYDLSGNGKTLVRGGVGVFWNFTPGGTSSSKAQNPPFLQSTAAHHEPRRHALGSSRPACRRRRASTPTGPPRARRARSSTSTSATPTPRTSTSTSSGSSAGTTWSRSPTSGRAGRQMLLQGEPQPGAARRWA